jgi:DNA-binding NtrC family response regulator
VAERKTILVIDDEENIRRLYRDELGEAGYQVVTAAGWEEARALLAAAAPDLVTLDIRLGEGPDGIEILRRIKEARADLPVILVTAYGEYRADFAAWASEAYVVKSADLAELREQIALAIGPGLP